MGAALGNWWSECGRTTCQFVASQVRRGNTGDVMGYMAGPRSKTKSRSVAIVLLVLGSGLVTIGGCIGLILAGLFAVIYFAIMRKVIRGYLAARPSHRRDD